MATSAPPNSSTASVPDKTTTAQQVSLKEQLDRLAAFEPNGSPVISLYLDTRADQHGRPNYDAYLRKALPEQASSLKGDARKSVEADVEHIQSYLGAGIRGSANGLAIFACHGANLFEAIELDAPVTEHWLSVSDVPHLYPLARLNDQYPRYAALLVNTNSARLFVFSLGTTEAKHRIANQKTRKTTMGGWSQARYQRHNENFHLLHMKEVVDTLDKMVTAEGINHIVVSCDEVARPLLLEQLPKHLADKIIDIVSLPVTAPDHEVLQQTMEVLRGHDANTDIAQVEEMLGAWRAGGLGTAGLAGTRKALEMGQVEELLITAQPGQLGEDVANELVTKAQQTSARVRFIEDTALLDEAGGVGAILRFRI